MYAEIPERGFAPATGKVLVLDYPAGPSLRIDSGISQRQQITTAFDSLLAKVIVHARTRNEAALNIERAMRELVLLGCETNTSFLARVLADQQFLSGQVHTGYLGENPQLTAGDSASDLSTFLAAAALLTRPVTGSACRQSSASSRPAGR
ncbi:hypothetical protein [Sinorhizobium saheli]|uniref:hypothetical protein n=1 Tax=Sinorhizobium saheli TaxID=36856 RepID=UPI001F2D836F|nr:hypothetical protein [Sinorhizobium saheli]